MASRSTIYTTEILRLAASLPDPRPLAREHGRAELRAPTCGSRITTVVELDDAGRVANLSQIVRACAFGQAAATLLEANARGRSRDEAQLALTQLSEWLASDAPEPHWPGIAALAPARSRTARHGAILLPFRALLEAIDAAGASAR